MLVSWGKVLLNAITSRAWCFLFTLSLMVTGLFSPALVTDILKDMFEKDDDIWTPGLK